MKKLLLPLFSLMLSFNSYGDWDEVGEDTEGITSYIDTDTIKKHEGYIYYWVMSDYLKPNEYGTFSAKAYIQGDCGVLKIKYLSYIFYKQPKGEGIGATFTPSNSKWEYPTPESSGGVKLNYVCDNVD